MIRRATMIAVALVLVGASSACKVTKTNPTEPLPPDPTPPTQT